MKQNRIKILIYLFLISVTLNDLRAENVIDSLKNQLITLESNEERSLLCREIGDKYFQEDRDSILFFYDKALQFAKLSNTHKDEISAWRGYSYYFNNVVSDYEKAREYSELALAFSKENKDDYNIALVQNDLGIIAWRQGDYVKATEYYFAADAIASMLDDADLRMRTQLSLGTIHNEAARNEEARVYYEEAIVLAKKCGHKRAQGAIINNLGKVYRDLEDYAVSNSYFEEGLATFIEVGDKYRQSLAHYNLGYNKFLEKKYQEAIVKFEEALEFSQAFRDNSQTVMIITGLAETYEALRQDEKAIELALDGLNSLKGIDTKLFRSTLNMVLARSYERQGDFQKSSFYFKDNLNIEQEEQILNQEQELVKMQAIYENERRLSQIEKLEIQNSEETAKRKNTTYAFIFSVALLLFSLAVLALLFYRTKLKQLEKYDRRNRGNEQSSSSLLRIRTISNEMISNMHDLIWSMDKEKESLDDLINRMRDHVSNVFSPIEIPYRMQVGDYKKNTTINSEVKNNVYSVFKESINNIVKHVRPEITRIKVDIKSNVLTLSVENDKKEVLQNQYSNKRGLKSMEERAIELGGKFEVKDEEDKFIIIFKAKLS